MTEDKGGAVPQDGAPLRKSGGLPRTDDVAHRIEYVTGGKWTPVQYRQVTSILRDYRHDAIMAIVDRASGDTDSNNPGVQADE